MFSSKMQNTLGLERQPKALYRYRSFYSELLPAVCGQIMSSPMRAFVFCVFLADKWQVRLNMFKWDS